MYDFSNVNFTGFSPETIEEIKKDSLRFLDYVPNADFEEICDTSNTYYVSKNTHGDLNIQVVPKGKSMYAYGIYILKKQVYPYHHSMA